MLDVGSSERAGSLIFTRKTLCYHITDAYGEYRGRLPVASSDMPKLGLYRQLSRAAPSACCVSSKLDLIPPLGEIPAALIDLIDLDALGGYRLQNSEPYGVELSLLASIVLGGSSIPRAIRLRKTVPTVLSVLATFGMVLFGKGWFEGNL